MRKMFAFAAVVGFALAQTGCGCTRPFTNWFNRGDDCNPPACTTGGAGGWMPRATGYAPSGPPMILPGQIEVVPAQ